MTDDIADMVSKSLTRAWNLGQLYWQQADSDFASQHRKSDETQGKFEALIEETRAALTQPAPQGVAEVMALVDAYALAEDGSNRESIEQAITALMQERDALKSRVVELEGDVAWDAARYKLLRNCPITVTDGLIDVCLWSDDSGDALRGDALDAVVDAALAASPTPSADQPPKELDGIDLVDDLCFAIEARAAGQSGSHRIAELKAELIRRLQRCADEPRAEQQGEQEPVAWLTPGGDVTRSKVFADEQSALSFGQQRPTPLYTQPSPSLAELRAKVEALAGTAGTELLYRRDVLAEIDKLGGKR